MIKIDMEMPGSCYRCKKYQWSNWAQLFICDIDGHSISFNVHKFKNEKSGICPLIECEE